MNRLLRLQLALVFAVNVTSPLPAAAEYVFNKVPVAGDNSGFWGVSATTQKFMLNVGDVYPISYIYDPTKSAPDDLVQLPLPPDRAPPALPWLSVAGLSINDAGVIVGALGDAEREYGFIYKNGVYSVYSRPGSAASTIHIQSQARFWFQGLRSTTPSTPFIRASHLSSTERASWITRFPGRLHSPL
jgi:hypothetical protein